MARRRELADVADGISGHFISEPQWSGGDWPLGDVALVVSGSSDLEFRFDLLTGTVAPWLPELDARAVTLRSELERHLRARSLPNSWIVEASLVVWVEKSAEGIYPVRCQVAITDDLRRLHTSTRRASVQRMIPPLWIKGTLLARLRARIARRR